MKRLLLLLAVVWSPLIAGVGTPVLLDITDRSTFTRTGNIVMGAIPLAESFAVTNVRNIAITTAPAGACAGGVNLVSDRLVTERWHGDPTDSTKNIKSIFTAVLAPTLAGSGVAHVCLTDRSGADPVLGTPVVVNPNDTCADATGCITMATGVNKYWIRKDGFNIFDQVRRISDNHDYVTHTASSGIQACIGSATIPCPAANLFSSGIVPSSVPAGRQPYAVSVEEPDGVSTDNEDGQALYGQVAVSGSLWNSAGAAKYTYTGRLYFFSGSGTWLWKGTNIYSEDMYNPANLPSLVGWIMPTTLGNTLTATFGTAYGNPASTSAVPMTGTDTAYGSQYNSGNIVSNVAPTIGGTTSQPAPWYVCDDVNAPNLSTAATTATPPGEGNCPGITLPGFRTVKGTATQVNSSQSDCWMGLDDGTDQANVWMRECWQVFPWEVAAEGNKIGIYQWPKHGDVPPDGRTIGDLTASFNYARDMALASQQGFGQVWPFAPGPVMSMTPITPNPIRAFFALVSANASQPVVLSAAGVNIKTTDAPCVGIACNFWPPCTLSSGACTFDSTKARKVYIAGFTGTWLSLNGYKLAMWNGGTTQSGTNFWPNLAFFTQAGAAIDASGFGTIPVGCLKTTAPLQCTVGTMDDHNNAQTGSFGRPWELAGNFTSHAAAAPGADAARWRDNLMFTNPTYYSDTTLFAGHMHAQDVANFKRSEREITAYFNNLYKRQLVANTFGIYYGLELYGTGPAGSGARYFASLSRRRYDVGYWLQFMRTGDPTFFHRGQSMIHAAEVQMHHPPQVAFTTGTYAGVGLDRTGSSDSNPYWDTWHFVDFNANLVAKHDGSTICTESTGSSVWFSVYNFPPAYLPIPPSGTTNVNACSDGQQPTLDYPTTTLRFDYDFTGNPRDKELIRAVGNNLIFSATQGEGTGFIRTLTLNESSRIYDGGCFGRAFAGGMQVATDAAEILGNSPVNYIDVGDRCFAANIQDSSSGVNVWTQNPSGILFDSAALGTKSATPTSVAQTQYGSHYFANIWSYWSFPEYVNYKGCVNVAAPAYATGHAPVNVCTALHNMANGVMGYFNTTTRAGGLYTLIFPGRIASDSYALRTGADAAEFLKYIKRGLDFYSIGASDVPANAGCGQSGSASSVGDTASVAPTGCSSPSASPPGSKPPFDLHSTTNPNAIGYSTPDVHSGGPLAAGLPYLEEPAGVLAAAMPDFPPTFVDVPDVGTNNSPRTWITNCAVCGSGFTFDLAARIGVSGDFGNLSVVTPISGDWSLTVLDPAGNPVNGITVQDSAGHTYTGNPTAVFKTPNSMWPPAAGGGAGLCLAAPAPPSINYTADGLNNKDNRVFKVTVPGGANGKYTTQLTEQNCADPNGVQLPVAAILGMSTGNVDLVTTTCTACLGVVTPPSYVSGVSGCAPTARQVITYTDGGGTGATGSILMTAGGLPTGAVAGVTPGTGYTAMPTQGTIATCTGTATFTGGALGPPISSYARGENSSVQFANVTGGVQVLKVDSSIKFALTSPSFDQSSGLYRGSTVKTVAPVTGGWGIWQNGGWQSQSSFVLTHGGTGGVKPLLSPSPQTFFDSTDYINQTFVSNINNPITLTFNGCFNSTASLHAGTKDVAYSPTVQETITGCGAGTPVFAVTGGTMPPGMSLSSGGLVSGTPTAVGTFTFTVSVTSGPASIPPPAVQSIVVNGPPVCTITSTSPFTSGNQGVPYTFPILAANCTPPLVWSITTGSLPTGLTINQATGVVSGVPTVFGTYTFTPRVTDNIPNSSSLTNAQITVAAPPPGTGGSSGNAKTNAVVH